MIHWVDIRFALYFFGVLGLIIAYFFTAIILSSDERSDFKVLAGWAMWLVAVVFIFAAGHAGWFSK